MKRHICLLAAIVLLFCMFPIRAGAVEMDIPAKSALLMDVATGTVIYAKNPDAKLIGLVEEIDESIEALAGGAGSKHGTGGMATKISAAKIANRAGIGMVIINGAAPEKIYDLLEGKEIGTYFCAK